MKKVLIAIICFLMIPLVAFADVGAPTIKQYKVRVSNPNGVVITDGNTNKEITKCCVIMDVVMKKMV